MIKYYICIGQVTGSCGVHHRTFEAAENCAERFARDVKRGHGLSSYSDRVVYAVTADGDRHAA